MAPSLSSVSSITPVQAAQPDRSFASGIMDHVGDASMIVGLATLAAMVPLHGRGAGQAAESASLLARLGRVSRVTPALSALTEMTPATSAAATHVKSAWATLGAQRVSFGNTAVGRALIASQGPLAAAGVTLAGLGLARDLKAWKDGNGDAGRIALDLLGLAPAVSAGVKTVARARALASNSAAAETAAAGADELARGVRGVARQGHDALEAASSTSATAVTTQLDEAVEVANGIVSKSEDVLAATPLVRVADVPVPTARPSVVNQLGARAPRQASEIADQLAVAERKVTRALEQTADGATGASAQAVRDGLSRSLKVARSTRQQVDVLTDQAVAAERTAVHAQVTGNVVAGTNSTVNLYVNSSRAADAASRDRSGAATSGITAVRLFMQSLLKSNARTVTGTAGHS